MSTPENVDKLASALALRAKNETDVLQAMKESILALTKSYEDLPTKISAGFDATTLRRRTIETSFELVYPRTVFAATVASGSWSQGPAGGLFLFSRPAIRINLWVKTLGTTIEVCTDNIGNHWYEITPYPLTLTNFFHELDHYCYGLRFTGTHDLAFTAFGAAAPGSF